MNSRILKADTIRNGWGEMERSRIPGHWKIPYLDFSPLNVPEINMPDIHYKVNYL